MKPEQIVEHFINLSIKQRRFNESSGEESVIIAWWERDVWADMPDDVWEHVSQYMNETYDWSNVSKDISQLITENMK
jgi:hypothetical protein